MGIGKKDRLGLAVQPLEAFQHRFEVRRDAERVRDELR